MTKQKQKIIKYRYYLLLLKRKYINCINIRNVVEYKQKKYESREKVERI